jgi:aryl-alcohol dehydrogenase-like predicted oxidoreductase
MRVPGESLLAVTAALRNPELALAAVEAVRGNPDRVAVEGLAELAATATAAKPAAAALAALGEVESPLVTDAVRAGLRSRFALVRGEALRQVGILGVEQFVGELQAILAADPSWPNRRAALDRLGRSGVMQNAAGAVWVAATDPHWRVRHAAARLCLDWGPDACGEYLAVLPTWPSPRTRAFAAYLRWRWAGEEPADWREFDPSEPAARCPFWDWDPAVLAHTLDRMGKAGRRGHIDAMPFLVGHEDDRVWSAAVAAVRDAGEPRHFADCLAHLDDPRTGAEPAVRRLFAALDGDRCEAIVREIAGRLSPTPAQLLWASITAQTWGLTALHVTLDAMPDELYRGNPGFVPVVGRVADGGEPAQFLDDATFPSFPPAADHPFVRAAALTPERAAELVADPTQETSWHVLAAAARMAKVPLWDLEPEMPWRPPERVERPPEPITLTPSAAQHTAELGPSKLVVSRLGVSGHYGLPVEGFRRAAEEGVNLFFWEPNYATLTAFSQRLAPSDRQRLHFVAGTFEADPKRVRRDAERALRQLRADQLGLFLVFWVQSWGRVTDALRRELDSLVAEGTVATAGLSTHNRPLAVAAIGDGWNPVMVRHNAAHRGAEAEVFPAAAAKGVSLLTFNATCYGRLLRPFDDMEPPSAADCLRYSLEQPAVAACWTAPATLEQLDTNLEAFRDPALPADRREHLLHFGGRLYREETVFRRLVRQL